MKSDGMGTGSGDEQARTHKDFRVVQATEA
jgi:hypothetical protein